MTQNISVVIGNGDPINVNMDGLMFDSTIEIGTTTTLPAGSQATVTNVGTTKTAILNFGIPKGDIGEVSEAQLTAGLATKVGLTGNETIAGIKTFSSAPIMSTQSMADYTNKRFITDAQQSIINNTSNINTGDETQSTILTKLDGMNVIGLRTCSTASATAAKVVSLSGFTLVIGATINITFTNANTANSPTLNINSTGAISIASEDGSVCSATNPFFAPAGATVEFIYNGTYWTYKNKVITNYINGASWYKQYSNGFIEQGQLYNTSMSASTNVTISLLKSFTSSAYTVLATVYNSTVSNQATISIISTTTSNFVARNCNGASAIAGMYWEARGY